MRISQEEFVRIITKHSNTTTADAVQEGWYEQYLQSPSIYNDPSRFQSLSLIRMAKEIAKAEHNLKISIIENAINL